MACKGFLSGCLGTVYKTVFSAWLSGLKRLIACSVLGNCNVAALPVGSAVHFLYLRLHAVQLTPLGCQSLLKQHRESCAFPQIRLMINYTTAISQAPHDIGMAMTGGECRSIMSPKFGRWPAHALAMKITVKYDRLFHLPYFSNLTTIRSTKLSTCHIGRICLPFIAYSLGSDRYNIIYEAPHPPPFFTAHRPEVAVSNQNSI